MKKLFTVLVLSILLFSCSAEESSQTTHSFTIPEYFRGDYYISSPPSRYGEPVTIEAHSLNINGLIIDTGLGVADNDGVLNDYYYIFGAVTDNNGVRTIYGTHDVTIDRDSNGRHYLTYENLSTNEEHIVYISN